MHRATLLLGSNLGDSQALLHEARTLLGQRVGVVVACSPVERTAAWGMVEANDFFNQVVVVQTPLEPLALLDICQDIEHFLGRQDSFDVSWQAPNRQYADRTMDIDILYFDDQTFTHPRLAIPHPRIADRPFVVKLLREIS